MHKINLEISPLETSAFSESQLRFYTEACVEILVKQGHESGVVLLVDGEVEKQVQLIWGVDISRSKLREIRDMAEYGAITLAVYLVEAFSDYQIVEQSVIGTGFDYWLGYKSDNPGYNSDNFINARLEVSGISKGTRREVRQRLKDKIRQLEVSDRLKLPAMIIVVEFSKPFTLIFVK